ncbi:PLP-dependent aspartate aminotransferase family protein [Rufibacter glacialis]|uniref:Aminotransferase class I/II-fold pyridoxal phosphate-dependent enzyme n=1 Tax=Rufibacter glacialis TaxID=1259555 RepID=A0A5M8QMD2_9BACT|nr:aminotransferase class I/II-fold pyridoxal phosphate-dependent enzyme [Rufibacter glacialis]KAA6435773.1 aminotransferase class I/II-fold pyridoxal phosphate-dependent enzyme [Rufibacter glacialis]GGK66398.1 cystathionine gamma-synthase [Rufibacter glacialis]
MDLSYILNELGEDRAAYFNAVAPPIIQTSNFACKTVADMRFMLQHEAEVDFYSRGNNPTVDILEKKLAALEGTEHAIAFGSGMGAVAAAVLSQVKAGDHVVCVNRPYIGTNKLMRYFLPRFGVEVTMVDGTQAANFAQATKENTTLYYLESPNSFTFELQDIAQIVDIARERNICTVIDNSFATPLLQNPAAMGVDLVVHSATKYIGGHSDVMGGIVCGSRERINRIFAAEYLTLGAVLSPHDAWLLLRGLRTLPLRMERVAKTTRQVVAFLQRREEVAEVLWPFLPEHPQYRLARKQLRNNTGQFTVRLQTESLAEVERFCDSLQHFLMAASWGGHESLIYPAAAAYMEGKFRSSLPFTLIRFYIGLEDPEYLIRDLEQAFARMKE